MVLMGVDAWGEILHRKANLTIRQLTLTCTVAEQAPRRNPGPAWRFSMLP